MKKNKTEKLQLNRETLQQLQNEELEQVAGGGRTRDTELCSVGCDIQYTGRVC